MADELYNSTTAMNASDELKTRLVKYENSTTPLSKFHVNEKKAQMHNKDASNNAKGAISNNDNENIPEKNAKGARKQGGQSKRKWKRYTYGYSRYNRNSQS